MGTPTSCYDRRQTLLTIPNSGATESLTINRPNKLVLFDTEETNRPLLNDINLDPDANFFPNLIKECKYYSSTELKNNSLRNSTSLAVMHINCRSILPKLDEIGYLLHQVPPSILAVTETWLTESTATSNLIPGYIFEYENRKEGRGGGLGLFIKEGIEYSKPNILTNYNTFESLVINIVQPKNPDILIIVIYRPPGHNLELFNTEFESLLEQLTSNTLKKKRILITGDFNIDLLSTANHAPTDDFFENLTAHYFLPLILQPTRITPTSSTLIDNIFTNSVDHIIESAIIMVDISDHLPIITWILNKPYQNRKVVGVEMVREVNHLTTDHFKDLLMNTDWSPTHELCLQNDANSAYDSFTKTIVHNYNLAFPLRPKQISKRNSFLHPWMTKGLLRAIRRKEKLYIAYIRCPSSENKKKFTEYRNKFKVIRNKLEINYYTNEFVKYNNDVKKTWRVIKSLTKTEKTSTELKELILNNGTINDPLSMANHFNSYFTNLAHSLAQKISPATQSFKTFLPPSSLKSFAIIPTSSSEVISINKSLKATHSSGLDELDPSILSPLMDLLAVPLADVINCSLRTGEVPTGVKKAKVLPIHKCGINNEISNFRPISILPFFSKFFEKVMYDRLFSFTSHTNLLYPLQHGFQPGHSTAMSLMDIQDKISKAMDNNEFSIGIFLDLAKAFDTVDHKILLNKLEHYGVRDTAFKWFKSYLTNRSQQVLCNGSLSTLNLILYGVPQRSILGPLLFLIYINDLPNSSTLLRYILFADDSNAFLSHSSYEQLISVANRELAGASDWFRANKLTLNLTKTNYIIFRSNKKLIPSSESRLKIEDIIIPQVDSTKFLGVFVDQHLKWNVHTYEISKKIMKNIGIIRRISHLLPPNILRNLYSALIQPYLSYCNFIWSSTYPTHLTTLKLLQKKALRIITKSPYKSHTKPLFQGLKILNIDQIRFVQTCEVMFKYANNLLPTAFRSFFAPVTSSISTRSNRAYRSTYARTNTRKFAIQYQGPLAWNNLPTDIRGVPNLSHFKRLARTYTLNSVI
jgi:hypothetical protein